MADERNALLSETSALLARSHQRRRNNQNDGEGNDRNRLCREARCEFRRFFICCVGDSAKGKPAAPLGKAGIDRPRDQHRRNTGDEAA